QSQTATPTNRDAANTQNQRRDGQSLLRGCGRRWWRLPRGHRGFRCGVTARQIKTWLARRISVRRRYLHGGRWLLFQRSGLDESRAVFSTKSQPIIFEGTVAVWARSEERRVGKESRDRRTRGEKRKK